MITISNVLWKAQRCLVYSDTAMFTEDGQYRKITSDVYFELPDKRVLVIKKGFVWDENSIPWIAQPFFPKSGKYAVPALVHDALYYLTKTTRFYADKQYKEWMQFLGIKKFQIIVRYNMVWLFGWYAWYKNSYLPSQRCINNRKFVSLI